ncbi:MAG: chitobiase/beta-hexosaminidase C-terminal domain-containing protein, partial [bacterium]
PGESQGDEPRVGDRQGTDPTLLDTDGDGFPDGWEYYFWYNARMQNMTGLRYNPLDVAQGTVIPYRDIEVAFDPLVPAFLANSRDMDNDGLSDSDELTVGTNPVNWDTDGDGMGDGWEVLRGLNPNDANDALPIFTPATGTTATNTLAVQISSADGAAIRYTLDGSVPSNSSALYQVGSPIMLTQSATVNARAFRPGMVDSATATASYTVTQTVAAPVLTPADGTYFIALCKVTMSCATAGAEIRYMTDGTEPTHESLLYTKAFNIAHTTTFKVKAFKGDIAESGTITATFYKVLSLSEAVDATNLLVVTGGAANWFGQTNVTYDGVDAAQSGVITDSQVTWFETSVPGPGQLSFWWKTSCEDDPDADNWDYLAFTIDGVEQSRIDGITDWVMFSCTLGEGAHALRWTYQKDDSLYDGEDCAWVDQVVVREPAAETVLTPVPVPYTWLEQYPALLGLAKGDYDAMALADVDGDGHTAWQEYVTGSIPTNHESVFRSLITMSNGVPWVTWTPDLGTARVYWIEGKTNLVEDTWGPPNTGSRFFRVNVDMP